PNRSEMALYSMARTEAMNDTTTTTISPIANRWLKIQPPRKWKWWPTPTALTSLSMSARTPVAPSTTYRMARPPRTASIPMKEYTSEILNTDHGPTRATTARVLRRSVDRTVARCVSGVRGTSTRTVVRWGVNPAVR